MAEAGTTTITDPIPTLIDEWILNDATLNQLSDAEWDAAGISHPSFIRCCEIEAVVKKAKPSSMLGQIMKAGLLKVRRG